MKAFCITPAPASASQALYTVCDTAVVSDRNPVFVPDFDVAFDVWPAVVVRIGRLGKSIAPRFAHRYVDALGAGLLIQARGRLRELSARGLPWTEAVAFDSSAPHGEMAPATLEEIQGVALGYSVSPLKAAGEPEETLPPPLGPLRSDVAGIISRLSETNTLKNGDLIYLAATEAPLTARPDTRLKIWLDGRCALSIKIK